jgi:Ca2+-binding EF-hand superfamily protein
VRVIKVATAREEAIERRLYHQNKEDQKEADEDVDEHDEDDNEFTGFDDDDSREGEARVAQAKREAPAAAKVAKGTSRQLPSVRLDTDIASIPPSSTQRRQFEEMFISDIAVALDVDKSAVEIHAVKPVVIMSWLVEVTFDVVLQSVSMDELSIDSDDSDNDEEQIMKAMSVEREERYDKLMQKLHDMVTDTTSIIYNGFITCKLDPSYSHNLVGSKAEVEIYSSDRKVLEVMHRYKDVQIPANYEEDDPSHFGIILAIDGQEYNVEVPNPTYMRQRHCFLWPYEVKKIIGLTDTMQEQWVEPVALHPLGLPRASTHTVRFEPSARMGGQVCLNTSRLQPGTTYEVEVDDLRSEVLMHLTDEEMYTINETFKKYDINQDGTVMKSEIEKLVRERTKEKKDIIERKFQERLNGDEDLSPDEIAQAEEQKRQHLQACNEAQVKQLKMFASADVNGDGQLSLTEFMLAESWWLRCTLNPTKAHLF